MSTQKKFTCKNKGCKNNWHKTQDRCQKTKNPRAGSKTIVVTREDAQKLKGSKRETVQLSDLDKGLEKLEQCQASQPTAVRTWQEVEEDALYHVASMLPDDLPWSKIELQGGSSSTGSDIRVVLENKSSFFIEVKKDQAHAGQFVVAPGDGENYDTLKVSDRSARNLGSTTYAVEETLTAMEDNSIGCDIPFSENEISVPVGEHVSVRLVQEHYRRKGVRMFLIEQINPHSGKPHFVAVPVDDIGDYANVNTVVRKKKSGSSNLPKRDQKRVEEKLRTENINGIGNTVVFHDTGSGKSFVTVNCDKEELEGGKFEHKFDIGEDTYCITADRRTIIEPQGEGATSTRLEVQARVTKLSKTSNPTVLNKISLKPDKRQGETEKRNVFDQLTEPAQALPPYPSFFENTP